VGQKVHPIGFRLGVIKDWQGRWYANRKEYTNLLHEDVKVRSLIMQRLADAGISKVEIERSANQMTVIISAAKPGIVIGKAGAKVEELRRLLESTTGKKVRVTIQEIRQPELDATLVARSIAEQLERRVAFRRAMKQAVLRATRFGAKGIRVQVAGRLGGAEMSRTEWEREGRVPLHTLRADIDYGQAEAHTTFGLIGVKAWIYKGDVLPTARGAEAAAPPPPPPPPPRGGRGGRGGGARAGAGPSGVGQRTQGPGPRREARAPEVSAESVTPAEGGQVAAAESAAASTAPTPGAGTTAGPAQDVDTAPGTTVTPTAAQGDEPATGTLPDVTSGPGVTNLPPELEQPGQGPEATADGGATNEAPETDRPSRRVRGAAEAPSDTSPAAETDQPGDQAPGAKS
jgi:small subunit ribosomal protein S3